MIRVKQIIIIKIRTKVNIKIELNQILMDDIGKKKFKIKYIAKKQIEDQI
jgi:hypothetical protein